MWTKQGLFLREEGAGFVAYLFCAQYELARRNKNLRYSPQDGCRDPSSLWREQWDTDSIASVPLHQSLWAGPPPPRTPEGVVGRTGVFPSNTHSQLYHAPRKVKHASLCSVRGPCSLFPILMWCPEPPGFPGTYMKNSSYFSCNFHTQSSFQQTWPSGRQALR